MPVLNIVQAVNNTLRQEMRKDDRIVVLGEDVGVNGGVFRATEGLYQEFGGERVVDTPLAEGAIVGVAVGMALHGLLPVAEIEFADFIHPAFDQMVSEVARMRYRSNGDFGLPMVVRAPWGGGVHGALYHSQSIEAFYGHVPGIKVVVPSTPYDASGMLRAAIRAADEAAFRSARRLEGIQYLFRVAGMRGTNDKCLRATGKEGDSVIALNGNRDRGEGRAVSGQQICTDRGPTQPGNHHLSEIPPIGQIMPQTELVGKAELVRQVVNLAEHVKRIELLEIVQIVKIHVLTPIIGWLDYPAILQQFKQILYSN